MVDQPSSGTRRIIYVAHRACGSPALCAEVRAHAAPGADVLVVAPVLASPLHRWTSDDAEDRALAKTRLEESIGCLRKHGLSVRARSATPTRFRRSRTRCMRFLPTRSSFASRSRSARTGFARESSSGRGNASSFR
jgi:hypothetical protein